MELYKIFAIINRAIKGLHCILSPARRKAKPMLTHRYFDHYEQVLMKSTEIFPLKQMPLKLSSAKYRPFCSRWNVLITGLNFVVDFLFSAPSFDLLASPQRIVFMKHTDIFETISHHFPTPIWRWQVRSLLHVNAMAAGDWATQGARTSAPMVFTSFSSHFNTTNINAPQLNIITFPPKYIHKPPFCLSLDFSSIGFNYEVNLVQIYHNRTKRSALDLISWRICRLDYLTYTMQFGMVLWTFAPSITITRRGCNGHVSQIPQCIKQISHNAPFVTEMCTHEMWNIVLMSYLLNARFAYMMMCGRVVGCWCWWRQYGDRVMLIMMMLMMMMMMMMMILLLLTTTTMIMMTVMTMIMSMTTALIFIILRQYIVIMALVGAYIHYYG